MIGTHLDTVVTECRHFSNIIYACFVAKNYKIEPSSSVPNIVHGRLTKDGVDVMFAELELSSIK